MRTIQAVLASEQAAPPSKPTELTARATSSKQIELTWTAAPDPEGVIAYLIERREPGATKNEFAQIAKVTTPSYSDKRGLFSAATYQYRIRAVNFAGELSPYSATVSVKTRPRQPALKEYWTRVTADLEAAPKLIEWTALSSVDHGATWQQEALPTFRNRSKQYNIKPSAYVDALCQLKAIEATLKASNSKGWQFGIGWNADTHFAIAGYEAARYALLRFDSSKAKLEDFLFYEALATIKETAKEEADSWGGKQPHKKGIQTPTVSSFSSGKPLYVDGFDGKKVNNQDFDGNTPTTLGEVVLRTVPVQDSNGTDQADAEIDAINILASLAPEDRELLTLRVMEEWTYAAIAEKLGISEDTAERRGKRLLEDLRSDPV